MADDTRQPSSQQPSTPADPPSTDNLEIQPYRRPKPKHDFPKSQAGKLWDAFGNPDNPVNEMPGGMVNTAGGRPKEVTWRDAFNLSLFTKEEGKPSFYQTGCARDSLLVGIGAGGGVGGLHFIIRGLSQMLWTTNFAVVTFAITAGGMYRWCTERQREEARGMAAAVAGMRMLHEKRAKEKAVAEAAEKAAKAKAEEEKAKQPGWKFW